MWGEEKEQKLHSGLEGNAIVCVLKAGREPKEAGKTVWAVFPFQLPGQKQDLEVLLVLVETLIH